MACCRTSRHGATRRRPSEWRERRCDELFAWREQDGILTRNVASIAEGPKLDHSEGRSLSPEQAKVFLQAVKGHRHEGAYVIALSLGLRRGEILGLSWKDIEATEGTVVLHVRRQLVRDKSGVQLVDLKTVGSRRVLHLSRPLLEVLERRRALQEAEELVVGKRWNNEHELIFTSNVGTPLDPEAFGRTVPKICKDAGPGHWSIHELRHSCASLLIAMEVLSGGRSRTIGPRLDPCHQGRLRAPHASLARQGRRSDANDLVRRRQRRFSRFVQRIGYIIGYIGVREVKFHPLTRTLVGRPGLDPGTLGLKVPCSSR